MMHILKIKLICYACPISLLFLFYQFYIVNEHTVSLTCGRTTSVPFMGSPSKPKAPKKYSLTLHFFQIRFFSCLFIVYTLLFHECKECINGKTPWKENNTYRPFGLKQSVYPPSRKHWNFIVLFSFLPIYYSYTKYG